MTSRRLPRSSDATSRRADACPPAADLTAFAADALPDARRAAISRHLLRCPRCHATQASSSDVLDRLRRLGAAPAWDDELEAAVLAHGARVRARRRGALAGVGAAAALALALFAMPAGTSVPSAGPGLPGLVALARTDDPAALEDLLRAQDADGRWKARGAAAGHDEGATGLAVLALVSVRPEALRAGPVAQAVGRATRWLAARATVDPDARPGAAAARDQALATAALLEVYAVTRDASLRTTVDRAVRALSRRAGRPDAEAWTTRTLARAEALGWHRGGAADEPGGTTRADTPWPLGGSDGSPCAQALAVLAAGTRG